jgi:hypothetical protein
MALCMECVENEMSLLCIGEWDDKGRLQAVVNHGEDYWMRARAMSLPLEQWLHVAIIQSRERLSFYIDGNLEDTTKWKAHNDVVATHVGAVSSAPRHVR